MPLFILCCFLQSCSHQASHQDRFAHYIQQEFHITAQDTDKWHLWQQKGLVRHRSHSDGYVLNPISPANLSDLSYHRDPKKARYIGNAHMAKIKILKFYEHGMENPIYRATAHITMADGFSKPCEIEWHPGIEADLARIEKTDTISQ